MNKIHLYILGLLSIPMIAFAHPGRTDAYGCHTCRTNCPKWGLETGEYHCHNAKSLPQPVAPIKSTYNANGTGYTTPAPEYAIPKQKASVPEKPKVKIDKVATTTKVIKKDTVATSTKHSKPVVSPIQIQPVQSGSWFTNLFSWLF